MNAWATRRVYLHSKSDRGAAMKRCGPQLFLFLLVMAATISLGCGASGVRMLQSVTLSPATADAQNYPDGQVQFIATGNYSAPPSPVTPLSATWGACDQDGGITQNVSVSPSGLAQCATGALGTYTVWAFDTNPSKVTCNAIDACGGGCGRVTGTAQITCP
jgi:hypothetical protein